MSENFEIKLSEHRKKFRVGSMAVEGLMNDIRGKTVVFIIDEDISQEQARNVRDWYVRQGAGIIFTLNENYDEALKDWLS